MLHNQHETDLLGQALGDEVDGYDVTPLTLGDGGLFVARVSGKLHDGREFSVVVKSRRGEETHSALWYSQDAGIADREFHVYGLLEHLDLPHARVLARRYANSTHWTLVLEDLAENYRLPDKEYQLSEADYASIIHTYANIHSRTLGMTGPIIDRLQAEEGSQANMQSVKEMLEALSNFEIDSQRLDPDEFRESADILFELREKWSDEPRCLVFSDFYQTNVALPKTGEGYAVLFDWEFAGYGLPQFDALNAGFDSDDRLDCYLSRMRSLGVEIESDRFKAGLEYARLSGSFYTLWLLHLKLKADPDGRLPSWMRSLARDHFAGGLVQHARAAR